MLNGPQAEPWLSHVEFRLLSLLAEGPRSFPEICKGFDEKVSRDRLRTAASRVELRKLVERIPFTERIERTRGRGGKVPQNVTAFALTVDGLNEAMKSLDYYRSAGERLATAKVLAPRDARVAVIVGREGARVLRAGEKVPRRAADEKERERLLKKASHEFRLCLRAVWECGLSRNEIETLDFADWVPGAKSVNLRDPSGSTRCVAVTSSMQECFDEAREMHLWGFVFGTVEGRRFTHPTWNREIKVARARTGIGADAQLFDSRGASRRPGAKLLNAMSPGFQRFYRAWKNRPAGLERGEVADLVWQMVDSRAGTVRSNRSAASIAMGAKFAEAVREAENARGLRPLFRTPDHRRWTAANVHAAFARLVEASSVPDCVVLQGSGWRQAPAPQETGAPRAPGAVAAQSDHIKLFGRKEAFLVDGIEEPRLPLAQYAVLFKLVEAKRRLSFDEIGAQNALQALTRLRRSRPRVCPYILTPGELPGYGAL